MHTRFATRPLYLQVRDVLVGKIAAREWPPGSAIPNEVSLSQKLGVSLGTLRKALIELENEKVVVRKQGRGTFVIDHETEEMAIRFSSIYDKVDHRIAGIARDMKPVVGPATPDEQSELRLSPKDQVYRVRRTRTYHDHPFLVETTRLPIRRFEGLNLDDHADYRISALAQKCGIILDRAIESVEAVRCPPEAAESLEIEPDDPVLLLNRVTYTVDKVPVEWRTAWCHLSEKRYLSIIR